MDSSNSTVASSTSRGDDEGQQSVEEVREGKVASNFDKLPDELPMRILTFAMANEPSATYNIVDFPHLISRRSSHTQVRRLYYAPNKTFATTHVLEVSIISLFDNLVSLNVSIFGTAPPVEVELSTVFSDTLRSLKHLRELQLQGSGTFWLKDMSFTVGKDLPLLRRFVVSSYCRSAAQLLSSPALNLEHLSVIAWHDTLDLYDHVPWSTLTSFNLRSFTCIDVEARLLSTIIAALDRAHNLHAHLALPISELVLSLGNELDVPPNFPELPGVSTLSFTGHRIALITSGELLQLHKLLLAFPNVSDLDSTASSSPPTSTRQFDSRMTSAQSTSTSVILPFLPSSFSFAERGFCVSAGHPLPAKRTAGRGRTSMKTSSARGFIGIDESGSSS